MLDPASWDVRILENEGDSFDNKIRHKDNQGASAPPAFDSEGYVYSQHSHPDLQSQGSYMWFDCFCQ
jgi:hypothetical protein